MIEVGGVNNLLIGGVAFVFSFILLLAIWSAFVRALFTVLGRSKLYFVPKTLKELFLSVAFILVLLSVAIGLYYTDSAILTGELLKIWQILLIFAVVNILVRVILTGIDVHQRKVKDRSGVYRSIGLLKGTTGLVLYLIALIVSLQVLSTEVGTVVTVIGLFIVVLFFVAAFDQIKSIIAGLQLGDYYVDVGNLITIDGHTGFVEAVHGRSTLLRTIEGKTVILPNSRFFNTMFEIDPEEISGMEIMAQVKAKEPKKAKERISAISSKIAIERDDMPKEFKPKVMQCAVEDGTHKFVISFKITNSSDVRGILDRFCSEMASAFGSNLVGLRMR